MPRKKKSAKPSLIEEQEERTDNEGTKFVVSHLLANARLRLPPEEEIKVLEVERLQLEIARMREQQGKSAPPKDTEWYKSNPDTIRRRQIVLKNPRMKHKSLCKLFDAERIGVPNGWEKRTWVEAYGDKKLRQRIHKTICTDNLGGNHGR